MEPASDHLRLLIALHRDGERQGPGSDAHTRRAIQMSGLADRRGLRVADVGCGTGASTLVLARDLDAEIVAVDFIPEFLEALEVRARRAGLSSRIAALVASMDALPFEPGSLDAIWSEGAIYNVGFEAGVVAWRSLLKPGGILAVSELTWLTPDPPEELASHWRAQYAEVGTASSKLAVLERSGYAPLGYFVLSDACWLEGYYRPLQARFPDFLAAHGSSEAARRMVAAEEHEIALYERHRAHVGYGFYIARKA